DHLIKVGLQGALAFSPSDITASIGDTVTFELNPKNHSVVQSSFAHPCTPLQETSLGGLAGFSLPFTPVGSGTTTTDPIYPQFKFTINDTAPIWGFCGQVGHCAAGMVFSINAVENGKANFSAFQSLARAQGSPVPGVGPQRDIM
ncbi:Cupredoxin, partial [Mycena sp. CBHHK59/15]